MNYTYVEQQTDFNSLIEDLKCSKWIAFDCEFKKNSEYDKELSIITVNAESKLSILDCRKINFIKGFSEILSDPKILKITHSGQNDYNIFYCLNNCLPQNTLDTQILALFCERNTPLKLASLVEKVMAKELDKSEAATDWMRRPLSDKQLYYALQDVIYLKELSDNLLEKIDSYKRLEWALDECKSLENKDKYNNNELKQLLSRRSISSLSEKEFVFLMRLIKWQSTKMRISEGELYKQRLFSDLLRTIPSGKSSMLNDTRIIASPISNYVDEVIELYNRKPVQEEIESFTKILPESMDREKRSNALDILYSVIDHICLENNISTRAVMTKDNLKQIKNLRNYVDIHFKSKYRRDFVGEQIMKLFMNIENIDIEFKNNDVILKLTWGR